MKLKKIVKKDKPKLKLKPVPKKEKPVEKKPFGLKPKVKLNKKKGIKSPDSNVIPFVPLSEMEAPSDNLTCDFKGSFPWKPVAKRKEIIRDEWQLQKMCQKMRYQPQFAFDTETNTLKVLSDDKGFKCVGISISWGENNNYYIPMGHVRYEDIDNQLTTDIVVEYLRPIFENPDVTIFGANLKFDMHVMKRIGIHIRTKKLFDSMLASWLCNENTPNGLKENSHEKLGIEQTHFKETTATVPNDVKKQFGYKSNSKVPFDLVLIEDGAPYAIDDAFYTWCLCIGFIQELEKEEMSKIYFNKSIPFMCVLFDMEEQGVSVDVDKLTQMGVEMQKDLDDLQYKIFELAGVEYNISSSPQKGLILFGVDEYTCTWEEYLANFKAKNEKKKGKKTYKVLDKAEVLKIKSKFEEKQIDKDRVRLLNASFRFPVTKYTDAGAPSTDADTIWTISTKNFKTNKRKRQGVEMCKLMLKYSKISKLKSAFVDGIIEQLYDDGKCHPSFNQIGTDSGRISCSGPNLQQLPKADDEDKYQIRSVFIGSLYYKATESGRLYDTVEELFDFEGVDADYDVKRKKIVALDYKNLEMMCLTHFSKDENLLRMFENNEDAHGSTACNMFNLDCTTAEVKKLYPHLRMAAKIINFMLMYGGGARALYDALKNDHESPVDLGSKEYLELYHCRTGLEVAQLFIDKYFESYSGVDKFIKGQKKFAHRNKYVLTILGRKRRLPDINSSDGYTMSYNERLSVNSAIQGTAGDITISAQIRVAKEERLKELLCEMIIQIHDEIVFECPEENVEEAIAIIKHDMEHPFGDKVKLNLDLVADSDFGNTYQDAK